MEQGMELGFNTMLFIVGIFVFIYLAFKRIKKLEGNSHLLGKKIQELANEVAFLRMKYDKNKKDEPLINEGDVDRE